MSDSIKVRAKVTGGVTEVKALINHSMETGQRKDAKTGQIVPAHFIQEITCSHNGENVLTAQWGVAISKNPYLSFKFSGAKAGDTLKVSWVDNKGETDSVETQIS
ncbi:MAG: thiosulfate oxidation carrier complex protein SoxZ [Gammaproteobacteria bacterium]|jgi:sulfur-oxidizing protein SoxZ|nr:thiosulfate oxidation carrier complex protein SoxZ [Gammaproteobacteria bacterium]HEX5636228.1 thiosulfate oxidation carrier complex protein SoxZ [Gammaproteobacteria bacterium]